MYHLTDNDSFPFVKDAAERHIRLCHQNIGGDSYTAAVEAPLTDLSTKLNTRELARKAVSNAGDTAWLADRMLDDILRKLQGRAKEYDLANPGSHTLELLLPKGNISDLINETLEEEPGKAHQVALKIKTLGSTHPLYTIAAEIDAAVDNCNAKIKLRDDAQKVYDEANASAEVAKVALIKEYNNNYHKAASDVDRYFAEKLFPRLHPKPKKEDK
jgi:hypothetical protein